jgi:protein-S-isoprenylcysteine O-methyltransferase Ste14
VDLMPVWGTPLARRAEASLLCVARATGRFGDGPQTLAAEGPYIHVRNPIYIGVLGVLLGTWPMPFVLALVFLPVMRLVVTRLGDPATHRRPGEQ